jgi:hypothetical protein
MDVDPDTGATDATNAPAGSQDLNVSMVIGKSGNLIDFLHQPLSCQMTEFRVNRALFPVP